MITLENNNTDGFGEYTNNKVVARVDLKSLNLILKKLVTKRSRWNTYEG